MTIVPVNGPIDTKTDFLVVEEQTTMRVPRRPIIKSLDELELFNVPDVPDVEEKEEKEVEKIKETVYDVIEVTPTALVLSTKKNKMPSKSAICATSEVPKDETTQEPVVITLKGIKFILNVKASEVIISDSSIEIK
jgi:hypothetical protein